MAEISWNPASNAGVVKEVPLLEVDVLSELEPRTEVPSMKVTMPEGYPVPGLTVRTIAWNVTGCRVREGFTGEPNSVKVDAGFTVWRSSGLVLVT